jgi:hypothetical protein
MGHRKIILGQMSINTKPKECVKTPRNKGFVKTQSSKKPSKPHFIRICCDLLPFNPLNFSTKAKVVE